MACKSQYSPGSHQVCNPHSCSFLTLHSHFSWHVPSLSSFPFLIKSWSSLSDPKSKSFSSKQNCSYPQSTSCRLQFSVCWCYWLSPGLDFKCPVCLCLPSYFQRHQCRAWQVVDLRWILVKWIKTSKMYLMYLEVLILYLKQAWKFVIFKEIF